MGDGEQVVLGISRRRLLYAAFAGFFLPTSAAQGNLRRVGILHSGTRDSFAREIEHFKRGMQDLGYVEGRSLEYVQVGTDESGVARAVAQMQGRKVEVIFTYGSSYAAAIRKVSATIPVVLGGGFDPVENGIANSLAHPERGVTGVIALADAVLMKHLQLVREVLPKAKRVVFVASGPRAFVPVDRVLPEARKLGFDALKVRLGGGGAADIESAFAAVQQAKPDAAILVASASWGSMEPDIVARADGLRLFTVFPDERYLRHGGVLSYGADRGDNFRRAAAYVDKVLKGQSASDLAIEQSSKFLLVINKKVAGSIGISVPESLLLRADRIIE